MEETRHVSLSTCGKKQVLTIPHDFALTDTEVILRKDGQRLIIEPLPSNPLLSLLTTLSDIDDEFPNVDEGLLPLDDIVL